MKKEYTEIVYILDRSGSMSGLEEDTIGGFNAMMEKQKKSGEEAVVSTVLFDDRAEVLHDRIPVQEVPQMSGKEYWVRGCTALLDAVGGSIRHIGNVHKYARKEDVPAKTLFVIATDGMENASRHYTYAQVKQMIERQREKYGWEFIFIGANIDAYRESERMGIRRERTVNYVHDKVGTANAFAAAAKASIAVMKAGTAAEAECALDNSGWDDEINEDYRKRGNQ